MGRVLLPILFIINNLNVLMTYTYLYYKAKNYEKVVSPGFIAPLRGAIFPSPGR